MSNRTIFFVLVALLVHGLSAIWRREARADTRLVPITLASLQSLVVLTWIAVTDVADHPAGPSFHSLLTFFMSALLPLSFVQTILALPRVRSRLKHSNMDLIMTVFFVVTTIGTAPSRLDSLTAFGAVVLAMQVATVVSLVLFQAGLLGPRVRDPKAEP